MAEGNRTDLNTALPKQTAGTGEHRVHGSATADLAAQETVPMAPQPSTAPLPGSLGSLTAPTERPEEPITSGVDIGAGPGADSRTLGGPGPYKSPLERVAEITQDPRLLRLARMKNG